MDSNEQSGLMAYIKEFLGKQKIVKFTKHNIAEGCQWNLKEYLNIFLSQFPEGNRLSCVQIESPFIETILNFKKFNITSLHCKDIKFINLSINELLITRLVFINVDGNGNRISRFIGKCINLNYLHLDTYDVNFLFLSDLKQVHLKTLKLTGILYHDYPIDDVAVFLKRQADSLERLTLKIQNNPNFITYLNIGNTVFPKLTVLSLSHTHVKLLKLPKAFINQISSIFFSSRCLTRVSLNNILSQLKNKKNINCVKFITKTLIVADYLEKFKAFQLENPHCNVLDVEHLKK